MIKFAVTFFVSFAVIFVIIRLSKILELKIKEPFGGWKTDCLFIGVIIACNIDVYFLVTSIYNIKSLMFFS